MSTTTAQTLVIAALCCYNTFGVGHFFLSNAFYHASFCTQSASVSSTGGMFFLVVVGMLIGITATVGSFELSRSVITQNRAARMMCTGTFYCMYTVLAFHLILSSLDPRFVVMGTVVLCGFVFSMRYDVTDALVAWGLSAVAGFSILVVEHTTSGPHARDAPVECSASSTATLALITGGIWAALPATFSLCYVVQFMACASPASAVSDTTKEAGHAELSPVVTGCILSLAHMIPIALQAANPRDAWAPMLHTETHMRIIEGIDERPATLFAILTQSVLVLASTGPVIWLLMSEVVAQGRLRSSDSAMWLTTVVLIAAWSSILMYADYPALVWLYFAAAAIVTATAPVASVVSLALCAA